MTHEVISRFIYRERHCVIRKISFDLPRSTQQRFHNIYDGNPILTTFHCGYVSTFHHGKHYDRYMDDTYIGVSEEPTYSGDLANDGENGLWYIGFDSSHASDTVATASYEAVLARTKEFADSVIAIEEEWVHRTNWEDLK